jgi:hypothetical protein
LIILLLLAAAQEVEAAAQAAAQAVLELALAFLLPPEILLPQQLVPVARGAVIVLLEEIVALIAV